MKTIKNMNKRLEKKFFLRDICFVADELIGKIIVRKFGEKHEEQFRITEIEMYIGEDDLACHAARGRTARTEIMYSEGGRIYVYLIYGMYWLLNFVTGAVDQPQAILVRGVEGIDGPGKIGRKLQLDKSFYGEDLANSKRIWLEDDGNSFGYTTHPRININYAGNTWKNKPFRLKMN